MGKGGTVRAGDYNSFCGKGHKVLVGKPEVKRSDQGVDGRIILRWIFRKSEGVVGTGWS